MKIIIIGGVAGGASCAARCRRLDENAEILVLDRGPYVSFANCGLPYYVGGVIKDESKLLLASEALFRDRFNIEVRTRHEAFAIDRAAREIEVRELATGRVYRESYDALVLSPGAAAVRPPLPGIDTAGIFVLRSIPDSREIRAWIDTKSAKSAVIVGGGFIGLEMAENLAHRGLSVTVLEMLNQVMPPLDPEMALPVQRHMEAHGIKMALGDGVAHCAPPLSMRSTSGSPRCTRPVLPTPAGMARDNSSASRLSAGSMSLRFRPVFKERTPHEISNPTPPAETTPPSSASNAATPPMGNP